MGGWVDRYRFERDEWRDSSREEKAKGQKLLKELSSSSEQLKEMKAQRWWFAAGGAASVILGGLAMALIFR